MRVKTMAAMAAGLVLLSAAWQAPWAQTPSTTASLTIHRGAKVSSLVDGRERADGVSPLSLQRGERPAAPVAQEVAVSLREADEPPVTAVGGDDIVWFVDRAGGRLTACELVETADLGKPKIRCRSRSLPR